MDALWCPPRKRQTRTIRRVTDRYPATSDAESRGRNSPGASARHPANRPIAVVLEPTTPTDVSEPAPRRNLDGAAVTRFGTGGLIGSGVARAPLDVAEVARTSGVRRHRMPVNSYRKGTPDVSDDRRSPLNRSIMSSNSRACWRWETKGTSLGHPSYVSGLLADRCRGPMSYLSLLERAWAGEPEVD
jgi:hypothetical protein